jgi:hypothetical protein
MLIYAEGQSRGEVGERCGCPGRQSGSGGKMKRKKKKLIFYA